MNLAKVVVYKVEGNCIQYLLHNFPPDELPPHESSVMKDDLLGQIFDEFKRRRQLQ